MRHVPAVRAHPRNYFQKTGVGENDRKFGTFDDVNWHPRIDEEKAARYCDAFVSELTRLDGYLDTVDPVIIPSGQEQFEKLLAVFELEKAVYELRYELSMRPDWLPIPVAGILRMLEAPVTT